jgi:nucleotide-binding universal stress UspA family protein
LLLGSTAGAVLRRSPVPVLVTRRRALSSVRRVLLPVDFDVGSERAARFVAGRLPARAAVHALFVVPPPLSVDPDLLNYVADERAIERDLRGFLSSTGLARARYEVRMFGEPAEEILRAARRVGADLIVISTHGRSGLPRHLLGSVAEKVVHHADRPVLVLPLTPPAS